jgi:hypothetical protein
VRRALALISSLVIDHSSWTVLALTLCLIKKLVVVASDALSLREIGGAASTEALFGCG